MTAGSNRESIDARPIAPGVRAVDVRAMRRPYATHRHDDYVVGFTTAGAQRFHYRRAGRCALPGDVFVLHPDEAHDGAPGDESYGYRAVYVSPELIGRAAGDGRLPFVTEPVASAPRLAAAVAALGGAPGDEALAADALGVLADELRRLAGQSAGAARPDRRTMARVREQLAAAWRTGVPMAALEAEHGLDRFQIARQFRQCYGVSPRRFLTLERLRRAEALLVAGEGLAATAHAAGFADQSHFTRQFRGAYGLTPALWRRLSTHPVA